MGAFFHPIPDRKTGGFSTGGANSGDMTLHNRTVRQDVRELGALLGDVLEAQTSLRDFETVEDLRTTAIDYRDGEIDSREELHDLLDMLSPEEESIVARAFTTYFELINLAEEREQVRTIRNGSQAGELSGTPEDAIESLAELDLEESTVQEVLNDVLVEPTFTGHPTEARRKTVKTKLRTIAEHLETLDERHLTDKEAHHVNRDIDAEVTSLWQTPQVRTRQPEATDEAHNVQWYLENTLYETVGEVYDELENALDDHYEDIDVPKLIEFRSWAGGDRAGNPYVTPEVTEKTLDRQRNRILKRYREDLEALLGVLSQDGTRIETDSDFEESIEADRRRLPGIAATAAERYPGEPYRQKLMLMRERLDRVGDVRPGGYDAVPEFEDDLQTLAASLHNNGAETVAEAHVEPLHRRATTFGFALASLDLRDEADSHTEAVSALLSAQGINYGEKTEDERIELLTEAILQSDPIVDLSGTDEFEGSVRTVCRRFGKLADWHREYGTQAIDTYCIANTESVSAVLEVLFLADQANVIELPGHCGIDIVPILETRTGLEAANRIFETLFDNEAYRTAIEASGNVQEVMVGFADTNKENGYLATNWLHYRAQQELAAITEDEGVTLRVCHGRGGPISRGDEAMNEALQALPPETVTGHVKLIEPGESTAEKYGNRRVAERNVEQMINAQLKSRGNQVAGQSQEPTPDWEAAFETMAAAANDAYCDLVCEDGFVEFFEEATPISIIEELDLGSRSYYEVGDRTIDDIEAVPWAFAWTQSRFLLHGWYSVASGIDAYLEADGDIETLKEMYNSWPYFRTVLDYAALALGRAEMEVAEEYAQIARPEHHEQFYPQIRSEYERAVELVTEITGRDHPIDQRTLRESLHRRNPYVEPLHFLQKHLLSQVHRTDTEERTLRLTIKGIAAGLKTTG